MSVRSLSEKAVCPKVVVLGAGPAGVGAAFQLSRRKIARVTVLEQQQTVGGNAGSFELEGIYADFGSHRLHPSCHPEILADLRELLGEDLRERRRHGRIRLGNRWIHFPLKPADLLLKLPKRFVLGVAADALRKVTPRRGGAPDSFASVLEQGLGKTICQEFYFPYARKLWGLPAEELSSTQARRRVQNNSLGKMLRKVASAIPGLKPPGTGKFYYPRRGYGQISQRLYEAARAAAVEFVFGARVTRIDREGNRVVRVHYERDGQSQTIATENVWSTLPVSSLVRNVHAEAPSEVLEAASKISFRGMILIYLVLEQDQFTKFDAHYFPGESVPISRLSEPKNYSGTAEPEGLTLLCAELPADPGSREWEMSVEELGEALRAWLGEAGLPVRARTRRVTIRKLRQAYPVYRRGYEEHFTKIDKWLEQIEGLLTFGRQGLFAHDNTHHALYMAYAAAECFGPEGRFDAQRWGEFRRIFETHVVED